MAVGMAGEGGGEGDGIEEERERGRGRRRREGAARIWPMGGLPPEGADQSEDRGVVGAGRKREPLYVCGD